MKITLTFKLDNDKYVASRTIHDVPIEMADIERLTPGNGWQIIQCIYGAMLQKVTASRKAQQPQNKQEQLLQSQGVL